MRRGHAVPFANSSWAFAQEDEGPLVPAVAGELTLLTPMMRPVLGLGEEGERVEIRSTSTVKLLSCEEIAQGVSGRPVYELTVLLFDGRKCRCRSTDFLAYRKGAE